MPRRNIKLLLLKLFLVYLLIQIPIAVFTLIQNKWNYLKTEAAGELSVNIIPQSIHNDSRTIIRPGSWKIFRPDRTYCDGRFISGSGHFAVLSDVMIDPDKLNGKRKGGENITTVLNQSENMEFVSLKPGFFKLQCQSLPKKLFSAKTNHLTNWENSIDINVKNFSQLFPHTYIEDKITVAIVRYDYANLYWIFVDIFDIFLLTRSLGLNTNVGILLVDAHPVTKVDTVWSALFPNVTRIGHLTQRVIYKSLVWGLRPADCPLLKKGKNTESNYPYLKEFREFVASKIKDSQNTQDVNCRNMTIVIVFRRDYVAHARNPTGRISRKISNELELLRNVSNAFRNHTVHGVQLDLLPVTEQIRLSLKTDILVGMHGAGLTHVMFLPSHAGLIELFPRKFIKMSHIEFIASWRKLKYSSWQNTDPKKEKDKYTTEVDVTAIVSKIKHIFGQICPSHKV